MASSSDWIEQLLERPDDEVSEPKTLSWLPDLAKPTPDFEEGMPFDRPAPEAVPGIEKPPEAAPLPDGFAEAESGDALEDILRKALNQSAAQEEQISPPEAPQAETRSETSVELPRDPAPEPDPGPLPASQPEPQAEPEPDPVAEAFARGQAEGRQAAMAEHQSLADQKLALRQTFRALDQAAMDALANDLAETVIALCSQTLADFIPAPQALKNRCKDAARRLGSGAGRVTLYLHPDDLAQFDQQGLEGWTIVGDPGAERGGLRLETGEGQVSDRPSDWRRAIATAIRG